MQKRRVPQVALLGVQPLVGVAQRVRSTVAQERLGRLERAYLVGQVVVVVAPRIQALVEQAVQVEQMEVVRAGAVAEHLLAAMVG